MTTYFCLLFSNWCDFQCVICNTQLILFLVIFIRTDPTLTATAHLPHHSCPYKFMLSFFALHLGDIVCWCWFFISSAGAKHFPLGLIKFFKSWIFKSFWAKWNQAKLMLLWVSLEKCMANGFQCTFMYIWKCFIKLP